MRNLYAFKGAMKIVDDCARIQEKEHVFISTDFATFNEAELLAEAAISKGGIVTIGVMPVRELDGNEPEETIAAAMKKADVVLMAVQKSLAHTRAVKEALACGARVLSMTAISFDLLASSAFSTDFQKAAPLCDKFAEIFSKAQTVTIQSKEGTNFTTNLDGRNGNAHKCLVETPGQFSAVPNIEANFSPIEGASEGLIVADASIPYLDIGTLSTPVFFHIRDGAVYKVEGGPEARIIEKIWQEQDDVNVYNIAQVAVGLNPEIKQAIGTLGCNYDEGAFGTMHIGIGTSSNLGGEVKATTHFDAVMHRPTLFVDGEELIRDGNILISS